MRLTHAIAILALALTSPAFAEGGAAPPKNDAGKGATRLSSAASYVPLPPINAATPAGRAIGGMLSVEFCLDIPDSRLRTRTIAMRPRVIDALRATVADYALTRVRQGGAPDPEQLSRLSQGALDRTLGAAGAKLLICNIMITDRR
jgi:hypothetical protein